ncbi:hypothetical protein FVQ98_09690 [Ottowia sp. GY511]|uniref:Translation initiation factor IF-2 n=1 Tax=Ottowia flava TaxID=2675430 RepID=A0ABW4KWZ5_9BURK|nr:hypothetical protein [Ottowia sp. GY511]TXK28566.1 hypothetical protein FVQ98_09690 [Ottowia sp. GY511]
MTQRNLRTVPAALLMTTALSWSVSALAQTAPGTAPARPASAAAPSMGHSGGLHPGAQVAPPGPAVGGAAAPAVGGTPPGAPTNGLPPGFEPAMPGKSGSGTAPGTAPAGGTKPAPAQRP